LEIYFTLLIILVRKERSPPRKNAIITCNKRLIEPGSTYPQLKLGRQRTKINKYKMAIFILLKLEFNSMELIYENSIKSVIDLSKIVFIPTLEHNQIPEHPGCICLIG
jgi:hypothetical protein